jgi:hemoglobin
MMHTETSTVTRTPIATEEQIAELVDRFYSRVRKDELLGPVFAQAVGDDWDAHLSKMTDFWSSVVLASRRYKGHPMMAHLLLPRLSRSHFERWLKEWRSTAAEVLGEIPAAVFVKKAEYMAERLLAAIDTHHEYAAENHV